MPRIARITMENAFYHIITRGNQKQKVFREPTDYKKYLHLLARYKNKFKFRLYCFCLMPNHVHLLIQVKDPLMLNKIMRGINLSYTLSFNYRYKTVGHLWQDRYKSKIIQNEAYLMECINYIENNPLRKSLAPRINKYPWSSYKFREECHVLIDKLFDE